MEHPHCLSKPRCGGPSASKRRDDHGLFQYHSLGSIKGLLMPSYCQSITDLEQSHVVPGGYSEESHLRIHMTDFHDFCGGDEGVPLDPGSTLSESILI